MVIDYRQDELDFSRLSKSVELDSWTTGLVELTRDPVPSWHNTEPGKSLAGIKRWFGRSVQDQLFRYLIWAMPVMVFGTAAAFVLASMA